MMIFKITLTVSGEFFSAEKALSKLSKTLNISSYHNPEDVFDEENEEYGYGTIFFMHPKIFGVSGDGIKYEEDFIEYFENNYSTFIEFGAKDFDFFTEVYYSDDQCNFEIFNRDMINRLNKKQANIAFPVSVYRLKKKQLKELLIIE